MADNNNDWDLIREEMNAEAINMRFERLKRKHELYNNLFLGLFPRHMRSKVVDIEECIGLILLAVATILFFILLIKH